MISKSIALALVLGLITSGFAQAKISVGCKELNHPSLDVLAAGGVGSYPFFAGETVVMSAKPPVTGTPTSLELFFALVSIDADGFPGTLSHQFLADQTGQILWTVFGGSATWDVECFAVQAVEPATPVPGLNWQGIVILVMLLSGFVYFRRRRIVS